MESNCSPSALNAIAFACLTLLTPVVTAAEEAASEDVGVERTPWCSTPADRLLEMVYDAQGKLRPIIPIRALTELSACSSRGPTSKSDIALRAIKESRYTVERVPAKAILERDRVEGMFVECTVQKESCELDVYFGPNAKLSKYKKAKTGGLPFAFLLGHAGDDGHYEITRQALIDSQSPMGITWPASVIDLLANAAGDADFYDWGTPAAHAQTSNDEQSGEINQTQVDAKKKFQEWIDSYAKKAVSSCRMTGSQSASDALYYLGYMLHGLQDLAFHEGITNAQHSFYDGVLKTPVDSSDGVRYRQKMAIATAGSTQVIIAFVNHIRSSTDGCWGAIVKGEVSAPSYRRKTELLGKADGMDFGVVAALKYQRLGAKVEGGRVAKGDGAFLVLAPWLGASKEDQMRNVAEEISTRNFR